MQWRQKLCVHPSRFARLFALTSGCWQILHVSAMVLDTQLIVAQQAFPLPVRVHGAGGRRHVCSLLHTCVRARVHASGTKPSGANECQVAACLVLCAAICGMAAICRARMRILRIKL